MQLALGSATRKTSCSPRTRTSIRKARPASSSCRRQHGRHHGARPQRGHALQVRHRHRHRPFDAPFASREALRRRQALAARSRSCGSTTRSPPSSKSGGKTRRAAKMQSLKVWHPDIMEFIECKWKEEQKAHVLIEKGGYEANFNGEAYSSIMFQNANLSVRVTDEFMQAVEKDEDWTTHWVTDPNRPARRTRPATC